MNSGRLARFSGVFVFEFVVVMLGVLAAQAVADWGEDRRLTRDAEVQFREARSSAIQTAGTLAFWAAVGPCLIERAQHVAQVAAGDQTMTAALIGRPSLPWLRMPTWDEDVRRAAISRFGADEMGAIFGMEVRAEIGLETTIRVRDAWSTFALLDPVNGPPTEVDRGNVRLAAIRVIDHIRVLQANNPTEAMDALGVKRSEWQVIDFETEPYDRCGLLREWR